MTSFVQRQRISDLVETAHRIADLHCDSILESETIPDDLLNAAHLLKKADALSARLHLRKNSSLWKQIRNAFNAIEKHPDGARALVYAERA